MQGRMFIEPNVEIVNQVRLLTCAVFIIAYAHIHVPV